MGLFNKKPPCAICGGKVGWLLPTAIEGEYICGECDSKIDMDPDIRKNLTMQKLREYLGFYEQNKLLKEKFVVSKDIDFGVFDTKMIFDYENKLFCMSKHPDKTVFEGNQIVSFTIKEDSELLVEGSSKGIKRHQSRVPERARALSYRIEQFQLEKDRAERERRMNNNDDSSINTPSINIPEPFRKFNVEIRVNHPYWNVMRCDMDGPIFSSINPSIAEYLDSYERDRQTIDALVGALETIAFSDVPSKKKTTDHADGGNTVHTMDGAEEIRKYKQLLDEGIISEEEFQAKKKQLLGI